MSRFRNASRGDDWPPEKRSYFCASPKEDELTMQLFQVDTKKCNRDGICIRECPFYILKAGIDRLPEMAPGAEEVCLHCGHCLAVCPTGAVTLDGVSPESCDPVQADPPVNAAALTRLVKTRRSIRVYKDRPVPRDMVERLVDTVRWTDTAKNGQPLHWLLVDGKENIREMAQGTIEWMRPQAAYAQVVAIWDRGNDIILRGAPLAAVVHAAKTALNPAADSAIAAATLELLAASMGLGSCWAGFFMRAANSHPPLRRFLNLAEDHMVCAALMLGYPKFSYHRIPPRQAAKVQWL
jgi:nitroreductase/NAD-dependent dihydropyrimidine dehydrogenase PreA subunit